MAAAVSRSRDGAPDGWAAWLERERPRIEAGLTGAFARGSRGPERLRSAMRHALFPAGKRLRPALAVLGYRIAGGTGKEIYEAASCLEFLHTFTLIHDDLPCMDDDDLRRGRPTVHRAFDEATAVLAGDALLNLAYETLARAPIAPPRKIAALATLSGAAGTSGVLGGQMEDILAEGVGVTETALRRIHERKTGSLLSASLRFGGELAGARRDLAERLGAYGRELGLLFQIVDDLLNVEGSTRDLGRPAGGDARRGKATYPRVVGLEAAHARRRTRERRLFRAAERFGRWAPLVADLGAWVGERAVAQKGGGR